MERVKTLTLVTTWSRMVLVEILCATNEVKSNSWDNTGIYSQPVTQQKEWKTDHFVCTIALVHYVAPSQIRTWDCMFVGSSAPHLLFPTALPSHIIFVIHKHPSRSARWTTLEGQLHLAVWWLHCCTSFPYHCSLPLRVLIPVPISTWQSQTQVTTLRLVAYCRVVEQRKQMCDGNGQLGSWWVIL